MAIGERRFRSRPADAQRLRQLARRHEILSRRITWLIWAQVLFSRYLVAVEVGGTLLLAALVGAIAMVGHERPPTEDDRRREQRQRTVITRGNGREPLDKRKEPIHG